MNWKYLDAVHRDTGFSEAWCDHIHNCLSSVSYSMMISGESFEKFYRSNGLRQGDPLSPYLFILGLEGLPCMLNKAESKGSLHGLKVARSAPPMRHLTFADDVLIFFKANVDQFRMLKSVFRTFIKFKVNI